MGRPLTLRAVTKGAAFFLLGLLLILSQAAWDVASFFHPERIEGLLAGAGVFAPFAYMALMMIAVVISPIPSLPLDIAAGAFFGPAMGTLYSVTGALAGAVISFLLARHLGRDMVENFLGGHVNFCTSCSDRFLTKFILISRLLPIVSFDVVSYGAGLTKVSLKRFALATGVGMIPLTFVYNYFGAALIFGKVLTLIIGVAVVALFFLVPRWAEKKGLLSGMDHENRGLTADGKKE